MIAGGTEAVITPLAIAGFCAMRALSTRNDEPEKASPPLGRRPRRLRHGRGLRHRDPRGAGDGEAARRADLRRDRGLRHERRRLPHLGAPSGGRRRGAGDAAPPCADAGLRAGAIGYINAHGTSTPLGDLSEVRAIKRVFGDHAYKLAVSSTKIATGHLLGAAGGLETGILALAVRHQILPPTHQPGRAGRGVRPRLRPPPGPQGGPRVRRSPTPSASAAPTRRSSMKRYRRSLRRSVYLHVPPQLPLEELRHPLVEVAGRGAAEAVLLAGVEGLLEGEAGLDQLAAQSDGVLRVDVVVRQAVDDQQPVLRGWRRR